MSRAEWCRRAPRIFPGGASACWRSAVRRWSRPRRRCARGWLRRAERGRRRRRRNRPARRAFSLRPASCQRGPNSPPPRMLALTQTPPRSSHIFPRSAIYRRRHRDVEATIAGHDRPVAAVEHEILRRNLKYGMLTPSIDRAACWVTASFEASNCAGADFSGSIASPGRKRLSTVGVKNSVTLRRIASASPSSSTIAAT